ncbi:MAG TPA: hypothetical protein DIV86_01070 [Alphaproteobacteria bacterium]|nr:hypothetical protein [Alphaproteobacteria bacterium]
MKKYLIAAVISLISISAVAESYKVLAIVNGRAISNLQLKQRVDIIMDSTAMPKTRENRLKVSKEAIEILINESIQAQEAKDKGVELKESELNAALADLEAKNGMRPGTFKSFVQGRGLSYQAALEQIRAGLIWKKTVSKFLRPSLKVSEREIKNKMKDLSKVPQKLIYGISEIIIPLDLGNKAASELFAKDIVKKARAGQSFAKLAKEHSAGRTGKKGGFVGYIPVEKVVEPLGSLIRGTAEGAVSDPKLIENAMYVIIKVDEIKKIGAKNDRNSVEESLMISKLERSSKRYIKELRQKAYIEKKYKSAEELL